MKRKLTCNESRISWATSLFSVSLSRPIKNLTLPLVLRKTEAAYACVTPTKDLPSTSIIWSLTWNGRYSTIMYLFEHKREIIE